MDEISSPHAVGVIDDHPVVIEGICAWLSVEPRIRVTYVGNSVGDCPDNLDVTIVDLNLDGCLTIDHIAALTQNCRRVIAFSQFTDDDVVLAALDAGAHAFVAKSEGPGHLLTAVLEVAHDRPYVTPTVAGVLVSDRGPHAPCLSEQERTALLFWFQSMSKTSVARRMGISPHTVDTYIRRARLKYALEGREAPTKADMLARAIEDGLIRPTGVSTDPVAPKGRFPTDAQAPRARTR